MRKKSNSSMIFILLLLIAFISSLLLGKLCFAICMSIFAIFSLRELLLIRGKNKIPVELELLSYILVVLFTMNNFSFDLDIFLLDYRLISLLILIDLIPLVLINNKNKYNISDALYLIGSTMFIGLTFNLMLLFRSYNSDYVIYVFLIAFCTDLFAYITGKYIGTHKFMSTISPKKTLEGAIGGLFMGTLIPSLYFISSIYSQVPFYAVFLITAGLSILGQIGDLVFSFIKREYGKKDFVNGGGILDVLDSIIFISLAFVMFISLL